MNANRRLEEFIFKCNLRQNAPGLFDKINAMELTSDFTDIKMIEEDSDNKPNNKLICSIDKE